jgi:hypothetical protein
VERKLSEANIRFRTIAGIGYRDHHGNGETVAGEWQMLGRRDFLRGTALVATVASAQAVSACSLAEYEDDIWGRRLTRFLQDGDASELSDLFKDHSTLVAFDSDMIEGTNELAFSGAEAVRTALIGFRNQMTAVGLAKSRPSLQKAVPVGSEQQGRMNKIELLFSEKNTVDTSCGPTRSEHWVDLYYQAGVHETGPDWVKWSIERIALIPRLETERVGL